VELPVCFRSVCAGAARFAPVCPGAVDFESACSGAVDFESACSGPVYFEFVELPVCSVRAETPAELIEGTVALPTRGAMAAVELEAPCSLHNLRAVVLHNPRAVVGTAARQASGRSEPGEPVRREEARDESAPYSLSEKVQNCAAVSDLPDLQGADR
jgi:hypothetical protein